MIDLSSFDKNTFTNDSFIQKVDMPWGYEIHFTQANAPYIGKILHINSGKRLSLQVHDRKEKSWLLVTGRCNLVRDNKDRHLEEVEMQKMTGYTIVPGQRHRLSATTDCDIFEASTPEIGQTDNLDEVQNQSTTQL